MKTHFMRCAALIVGLASANAQAAGTQFKIVKPVPAGMPGSKSGTVINATPFYSNIATSLGTGLAFGVTQYGQPQPAGGTGLLTAMGCDDVTLQSGAPNGSYALNELTFFVANFNNFGIEAVPTLLFYQGAPGNPATLIDGVVFARKLFPPDISQVSGSVGSLGITFPLDANGEATVWVCAMFDDDNGTARDENGVPVTPPPYDNLGFVLCDPPSVGSSLDNAFLSDAPVPPPYANPVGGQGNFGGNPVANTCIELSQ